MISTLLGCWVPCGRRLWHFTDSAEQAGQGGLYICSFKTYSRASEHEHAKKAQKFKCAHRFLGSVIANAGDEDFTKAAMGLGCKEGQAGGTHRAGRGGKTGGPPLDAQLGWQAFLLVASCNNCSAISGVWSSPSAKLNGTTKYGNELYCCLQHDAHVKCLNCDGQVDSKVW